jgi:hypothetical protein
MVAAPSRQWQRIAAVVIGISLTMGCGFDAVLKAPGPAAVRFVFSDTLLTLDTTLPLTVTVIAGGVPQAHPYLITFSYNPTVIRLTAGDDSLIALHVGSDSINIRFQSSLRAVAADTVIPIRVKR